MKAWRAGQLMPPEQVTVPVLSHCVGRGSAVFEVLDVCSTERGPALFRADAHIERFLGSAERLDMVLPLTAHELLDALITTARENGLAFGGLKLLGYRSKPDLGLLPTSDEVDSNVSGRSVKQWCWRSTPPGY